MVDNINASFSANGKTAEEQEAHDKKMAEVADNGATTIKSTDNRDGKDDANVSLEQTAQTGDEEKTARPDNIPEKFWDAEKGEVNVEALLKSQQDAEAALRAKQKDPESTDTKSEDTEEKPAEDEKSYDKAVANASAEFAEKGELSEDTFKSLEAVGVSKDMVNDYIEGQKAIVSNLQSAAFGEFDGSQEKYDAARDWAVENLNESELEALDVQITSRNPGIVKAGAAALAAKYAANADITPDTTLNGGGNGANAGSHFKSGTEMRTAMSDPRYKTDPAFRAEVSAKIANADRAGVNLFA